MDLVDRDAGRERREREHRAVVGDPHRRAAADEVRHGRPDGDDENRRRPAEQDDRRDGEDEADRDAAGPHPLDGNREALGERDSGEQRDKLRYGARGVRLARVAIRREGNCEDPRRQDGGHHDQNLVRKLSPYLQLLGSLPARGRAFI